MALFRKKKVFENPQKKKKSQLRDWTEALIVAAILALIIRTFVVQAFKIPSGSMEDTLLIGDHLLVNKFIYGTHLPFTDEPILQVREPERGDIIVFEFPEDKDKSYFERRDFIKRVIGLPGDTVEIRSKNVYVNGERYITPEAVFVMGDNRDRSYDSRFWGFVDASAIKGLAFIKYWSWDSKEFMPRWNRIGRLIE
ncbi:MAG: signal peptidase I [Desulfuromonadales bacterium]